jgi:hypothetical protein
VVFCQNFLPLAHKSAIYGEGSGPKPQPESPKSAISEKELVIFELRKVLFSEKHLRELPGACAKRRGQLVKIAPFGLPSNY